MEKNFKIFNETAKEFAMKKEITIKRCISSLKKPLQNNEGIGKDEIIGIAIALVIAAFVVAPGLRSFAQNVVGGIQGWYNTNIETKIFETK